jgi:hypothetical protein
MDTHIDTTRRQLGELGAMQAQTEDMERRILSIATARLDALQEGLQAARVEAISGDEQAKQRYTNMVHECGTLRQVIATAHANLA